MPLDFDNRFVRELPGESLSNQTTEGAGRSPSRQVLGACYSPALPVKPTAPRLLAHASEVADLIGLNDAEVQSESHPIDFRKVEIMVLE